eukprot:719099-Alexandrium_andersonii.AAC.1
MPARNKSGVTHRQIAFASKRQNRKEPSRSAMSWIPRPNWRCAGPGFESVAFSYAGHLGSDVRRAFGLPRAGWPGPRAVRPRRPSQPIPLRCRLPKALDT